MKPHPVYRDRRKAINAIINASDLYCYWDLERVSTDRLIELYDAYVGDAK